MKRGLTASIVVMIASIATLILNGMMAFVFLIAIDLAMALSGGSVAAGNVTFILVVLIIAMILSVINIVLSISAIINFRRNRENIGRLRTLMIWFVISLILTVVCDIILSILTYGSMGVWLSIIAGIIYVVCIVLILLEIRSLKANNVVNSVTSNS